MRPPPLTLHHLTVNTAAISMKYYTLCNVSRGSLGLFIFFCFDGTLHLEFLLNLENQSAAAGREKIYHVRGFNVTCSQGQKPHRRINQGRVAEQWHLQTSSQSTKKQTDSRADHNITCHWLVLPFCRYTQSLMILLWLKACSMCESQLLQ